MQGTKAALSSTAVWGSIVAGLSGAASLLGYTINADDQQALLRLLESGYMVITSGLSIAGALVALYGRIAATKQITGIVQPK